MRTSRRVRDAHPLVLVVAVVYAVALGLLVFGPWGWGLNRVTVRLYVLLRFEWSVAPPWVAPDDYGVILNVLLFVPLGACLAILSGRVWSATVLAAGCSAVVELVQLQWLDREASWADLLANTLGAFLGALAISLRALLEWRRAGRASSPRRR